MSTIINDSCIRCGSCEPECPNRAISPGDEIYEINPELCSECVGFYHSMACAEVCPVGACVSDPERQESEEVLLKRAQSIHPDRQFPALEQLPENLSHFR
jgi:ferredoxin